MMFDNLTNIAWDELINGPDFSKLDANNQAGMLVHWEQIKNQPWYTRMIFIIHCMSNVEQYIRIYKS